MIAIRVNARAHNMLPSVLAAIAEDAGDKRSATQGRWMATAAQSRAVTMSRTIRLPAVPRPGDEVWMHPYTEAMQVERVVWNADLEPDEEHVEVWMEPLDLDVIGDEESAIAWFREAGWVIELPEDDDAAPRPE